MDSENDELYTTINYLKIPTVRASIMFWGGVGITTYGN